MSGEKLPVPTRTLDELADAIRKMRDDGFTITESTLLGWTTPTGEQVHGIVLDKAGVRRVLVSPPVWERLK